MTLIRAQRVTERSLSGPRPGAAAFARTDRQGRERQHEREQDRCRKDRALQLVGEERQDEDAANQKPGLVAVAVETGTDEHAGDGRATARA